MIEKPDWLPELLPVIPFQTDQTIDLLYEVFKRDFVESQPCYRGHTVWFFPEKARGKELIFWHLTQRNFNKPGERFDSERSERLPWARFMLDNPDQPELLDWDYEDGDGTIKTYLWLKDYDYLVILKKYPDGGRRLLTAYWIEYQNEKRKLQKKYEQRRQ